MGYLNGKKCESVVNIPNVFSDALASPSHVLPDAVRAPMESRFNHDFSQVRLHTDANAEESADAINARAFTIGNDMYFKTGHYAPETLSGQKLLAHELTHVVQQAGSSPKGYSQSKLAQSQPGDVYETEADAVAERVTRGAPAGNISNVTSTPMVQRQDKDLKTGTKQDEKKKEAGSAIGEGLKTVAEQAVDNNEKVKKNFVEPAKRQWNNLGTVDKTVAIGWGAGTVGLTYGSLLSDPNGRKVLEGVNLATPFTLIPYMPLSKFNYTLPTPDNRMFKFETGFKADELINLWTKSRGLPEMSLGVNLQWEYDLPSDRLRIRGGNASLGLVPGLKLSGGMYSDIFRSTPTYFDTQGQMVQNPKSIPEADKPKSIPDVRFMVNIDLMKFNPQDFQNLIKNIF
jgi:hypothetical protein